MQAQLTQVRKELAVERERAQTMRKEIRSELQNELDTAAGPILASVLRDQAALEKQRASLSLKESELQHRFAQVKHTEEFLAAGQRHLYYALREKDIQTMTAAELEYATQQEQANAMAALRRKEITLNTKAEQLKLRENSLTKREQIWRSQLQRQIEADLKEDFDQDFELRKHQIQSAAYQQGFEDGKEEGVKEAIEEEQTKSFTAGYSAALHAQMALQALKNGTLPSNSPDLNFIMDLDHPSNPFNMIMQIGKPEIVPMAPK